MGDRYTMGAVPASADMRDAANRLNVMASTMRPAGSRGDSEIHIARAPHGDV